MPESTDSLPDLPPEEEDFFPDKRPYALRTTYGHSWKADREAARMKAIGASLDEIATSMAFNGDIKKAAAAVRRGLHVASRTTVDETRLLELDSLDEMERVLWNNLRERHIMVQQGRVIYGPDGDAVEDKRFALEVMDRILKVKERRAKYLGLDATTRISVEADQIGGEINAMIALIAQLETNPATPVAALPAGSGDE